jgi:hypothetical protein
MHFGRMATDASLTAGEIEMTPSQWLKSSLKEQCRARSCRIVGLLVNVAGIP